MDDPNQQMNNDVGVSAALSGQMNNDVGVSAALSGQIIIAGVVLIFVIFIALLILYLRALDTVGSSRSRRLVFAPQEPTLPRHALDPSILNSLPITIFQSKDFEEYSCLECAVCLCELQDGEDVRLLPKCNHGFHVECIDMWFHSNNTCPLCRSLVNGETTAAATETSVEIPTEPIAIEAGLETGSSSNNLNEGSSSCAGSSSCCASWRKRKEGVLVIDVPTRIVGAFSSPNTPLPSNKVPSNSPLPTSRRLEEFKSPVFGRMKSLKRILSRGKASFKGASSSYSSIGCDIEQGGLADSKCQ